MFIYAGLGFLGECEYIPGIGHVATRCFHVALVPLIPLGTYFVFDPGERRDPVRIAFSWKSYFCAWLTFFWVIGIGFALLGGAFSFALNKVAAVFWVIFAAVVAVATYKGFGKFQAASFARAIDLGKEIGVDYSRLKKVYGVS